MQPDGGRRMVGALRERRKGRVTKVDSRMQYERKGNTYVDKWT